MPEDKQGENDEPKTFTQEEVDAIRIEGKAEGKSESHSHFQSVFDREVAKMRTESVKDTDSLNASIREMRAANLAALPEGERNSAMIKDMYEDYLKPAPVSTVLDKSDMPGAPSQGDSQDAMQASINASLKELGMDPSKIEWGNSEDGNANMKTFLGSVITLAKGDGKAPSDNPEDKPEDKTGEGSESQKHIDISRGAGSATDYLKSDPQALVASEEWKPIRGMMD